MYFLNWSYANGLPKSISRFKSDPDDFQVNEYFNEPFTGEGEHILLRIEKTNMTTAEVIRSLAKIVNKPVKSIGYAGLKDRQARTTQWLSIYAPGEHILGLNELTTSGWQVLECTRHNKKLKPGFLSGNEFVIRLREISHQDDFLDRIQSIKKQGVPNYFGEQRFGHQAGNLFRAEELLVQGKRFKDPFLKGMYYSAARSWIFNLVLSQRVLEKSWNRPLIGDVMQLQGSNSIFVLNQINDEIIQRIINKDISPASPLPGKTKNKVKDEALKLINEVYLKWRPWVVGLEQHGLNEDWRPNILHVENFCYSIKNDVAELAFRLPAGAYATAVLRELSLYQNG